MVAGPFPPRIPHHLFDCLGVVRMDVILQELLSRQSSVLLPNVPENLERSVIGPNHTICLDIPVEDTKSGRVCSDARPYLTLSKCHLGSLALGNIEIHAENAVRPDRRVSTEPALG